MNPTDITPPAPQESDVRLHDAFSVLQMRAQEKANPMLDAAAIRVASRRLRGKPVTGGVPIEQRPTY